MENNAEKVTNVQTETQQNSKHLVGKFIERLSQKWESLSPEKRVYFTQLGLMAAVQAVDTLTTAVAFQTIPGVIESNSIARFFLNKGGMAGLGLVKMGYAAGAITINELIRIKTQKGKATPIINNILRVANSFVTAACVSNAANLLIK